MRLGGGRALTFYSLRLDKILEANGASLYSVIILELLDRYTLDLSFRQAVRRWEKKGMPCTCMRHRREVTQHIPHAWVYAREGSCRAKPRCRTWSCLNTRSRPSSESMSLMREGSGQAYLSHWQVPDGSPLHAEEAAIHSDPSCTVKTTTHT